MVHVMFDMASPLATTYKNCFETPQTSDEAQQQRAYSMGFSLSSSVSVAGGAGGARVGGTGDGRSQPHVVATQLLRRVKESVLLQMLSFDFELGEEEADKADALGLSNHSDAQIDAWYRAARAMEVKVEGLRTLEFREDPEANSTSAFMQRVNVAKTVREALLSQLLSEICGTNEHGFRVMRCVDPTCGATANSGIANSPFYSKSPSSPTSISSPMIKGKSLRDAGEVKEQQSVVPPPNDGQKPVPLEPGFTRRFQFHVPNLDFRCVVYAFAHIKP